ncbi:group III truncated hemoglobin [Pedobacter mucosus]|uniref:group III truncated hemoglobin n=1 Tax=Pedobacter mucosus TaxID=2895286 RepID=UPI001EE40F4D|nr:group III truncated hemoglobin [Pedobacter mucosus]UKT64563.1 group III truncated hemoglobin [Pedobacter mucosus]
MKSDINNRNDIILLVDTFYKKVEDDITIGAIFTDVAKINWSLHLPKMYDFWESILFGNAIYKGNPMLTHFAIDEKIPLKTIEFEAWKTLFFETVDELFLGEKAEIIKDKAKFIADLMHFKINFPHSKMKIV